MVARNRLILKGSMGTVETWSTGFHFAATNGAVIEDQALLQDWADNVATAIPTIVDGVLDNFISTIGTIDEVVAQWFPTSGGVGLQATAPVVDFTGGAAMRQVYQACMVFSMRTGLPGASFRGRNYWPAVGATVAFTGKFETGDVDVAPGRMVTLLEGIVDAGIGAASLVPMVYSPTRDLLTLVSSVQVGDVPDTQRRRRDALIEDYVSAPYPSA